MDTIQPASTAKSFSRMAEEIGLFIDGADYRGFLREGDSSFTAAAENGKTYQVAVLTDTCPTAECRFPMLSACGIIPDAGKERTYLYFRDPAVCEMLPLRVFLSGQRSLKIVEQLLLSRSLAAAFTELEAAIPVLPIQSFSLNALFADPKTMRVEFSLSPLLHAEMSRADMEKEMLHDGLLPPECCAGDSPFDFMPGMLRHVLAVLVFRCLTREDPFDGEKTLTEYPYRTETVLRRIYGYGAAYVAAPGSTNPPGQMIGENIGTILPRMAAAYSALFAAAFCDGITDSEKRPTAAQWESMLRALLNNLVTLNSGWWILTPAQMSQKTPELPCIRTPGGDYIAFAENKPLFRCMLYGAAAPEGETLLGRFSTRNDRRIFTDTNGNVTELTNAGFRIDGQECTLVRASNAFTNTGEGTDDA